MISRLRHLRTILFCLLAVTSLTLISYAQNVTTWHNDNNRTGWQQNETQLTPTSVSQLNNFGLLFQWFKNVSGRVYAQPLAATVNGPVGTCHSSSCDLVFVATEEDMLYAFNASPSQFSQTPVWSINLASKVTLGGNTGTYVDCTQGNARYFFSACVGVDDTTGAPGPFSHTYIGVTGTPVIDMSATPHPVLYAVGAVCFDSAPPCNNTSDAAGYYLFAVDIVSGQLLNTPIEINGTVPGYSPGKANKCTSAYPTSGNITFNPAGNPNAHLQRSALLLLNVGGAKTVYVAFADLPEYNNGWIFGYTLGANNQFQMVANFATTPYGTGGGIWGSGAGPAADANGYIYLATANGTIFDPLGGSTPIDVGDALLKLQPTTSFPPGLTVADWWTPNNVLSYQGIDPEGHPCTSLCECDEDLASGGVLVVPPPYTYTCTGSSCTRCIAGKDGPCSVVINADKQSNIYVTNQNNLGGYNPAGGNNIETVVTPCVPSNGPGGCVPNPPSQGYWSSPAYWFDGSNSWLYYAANMGDDSQGISPPKVPPEALNAYQLQPMGTTGPVSQTPYANSGASNAQTYPILFCDYAPTPSVSSNGHTTGSGIVWAIEQDQNKDNNKQTQGSNPQDCAGSHPTGNPGALHAFCAAPGTSCPSAMYELYSSRQGFQNATIGSVNGFPTPTIFKGQAYMGTNTEVDVFGLCNTLTNGCIK